MAEQMSDRSEITVEERALIAMLRFVGTVCLLALLPLLMPRTWIEVTHAWLEFGPFPDAPIAEYLARSTSGLAAFYGGLLWVLSTNIQQYRTVIHYQAIAIASLSTIGLVLGTSAGIPVKWLLADTVSCIAYCIPTLWLLSRIQRRS
jgi:hypothetical protein